MLISSFQIYITPSKAYQNPRKAICVLWRGYLVCPLPIIGVIMHDQNYCSSETTKLANALIQVQRTLLPATKDRLNPFTHSNYATLNSVMDSCREALLSNGIWLTQFPVPSEPGHLGLVTKLVHAESGQWQSSHAVVPLPKTPLDRLPAPASHLPTVPTTLAAPRTPKIGRASCRERV